MPFSFFCFTSVPLSYSVSPLFFFFFFKCVVINYRAEIKLLKASHSGKTGNDCEQLLTEHQLKLNGTFYESSVNHAPQLKT